MFIVTCNYETILVSWTKTVRWDYFGRTDGGEHNISRVLGRKLDLCEIRNLSQKQGGKRLNYRVMAQAPCILELDWVFAGVGCTRSCSSKGTAGIETSLALSTIG